MDETEQKEVKKSKVGLVFSWIFGGIFLLGGIGTIPTSGVAAVALLLLAAILIPISSRFIENKFNIKLSTGVKAILIIVLLGMSTIGTNSTKNTQVNNTNKPTVEQKSQPKTNDTTQQKGTIQEVKKEEPKKEEPKKETWVEVKKWSGTGIKKTEPFEITGKQWRVNWKNKNGEYGGILQIYVYTPGSSLPSELLANTTESTNDTSYVYKKGTYYLNINSANSKWEAQVEQLQ